MFCIHCGKEIEDGSKFCPYCGKAQEMQPQNAGNGESQRVESVSNEIKPAAEPKPVTRSANNRMIKILLIGVCVVALVIAAVFAVRFILEQKFIADLPYTLWVDNTPKIYEIYDEILGKGNYTNNWVADGWTVEKTNNSNVFRVTGKTEIVSLTEGDVRPVYSVTFDGEVKTNFFRTRYQTDMGFNYEYPIESTPTPEPPSGTAGYPDNMGPINVDPTDFDGTFTNVDGSGEVLTVEWGDFSLRFSISSGIFDPSYVDPYDWSSDVGFSGNKISCYADFDSIDFYYVPANMSEYGEDTIYMESSTLKNAIFTRTSGPNLPISSDPY